MREKTVLPLLGRLAVHHRMITMDQLAEATGELARRPEDTTLGAVLIELGFIDRAQLAELLQVQRKMVARHRAKQAAAAGSPGLEGTPTSSRDEGRPEPERTPARSPDGVLPKPEPERARAPAATESRTPDEAPVTSVAPSDADRADLEAMFRDAVSRGASDVHIHSGSPPRLRIHGVLTSDAGEVIDASRAERLVASALTPAQRAVFEERGELDLCYSLAGVGRFRANVYRQQRGVDGVFRFIPPQPPSLDDLGLPTSLARHTNYHQGMVLVTGPTGCGKSSTLAALVDLINEERREHILTIEDPIEYLHPSKRCLVNQRSVNSHTESFARALRAALREDPDVIVIGELRDLETISLALSAAETGHLVLATLHTNNSIRTLNRLVGAFPADQQAQIRNMISESLRAVISQRLISRADGQGRVAAVETLVITRAVGNLIRDNKTFQIQSILQTGASQGMGLLDHSIREHLRSGAITKEQALLHCEDPKVLED